MNERIRELAERADILFYQGRIPETGFEYEGAEVTVEDLKKFAELIVLDCIQYLNNEVDRLHKYRDSLPFRDVNMRYECDLFIEKCMDNIQGLKNHFGVEE